MQKTEEVFKAGEDYPEVKIDGEDLERDVAEEAAFKAFGIPYLFPWQRLVIANILDSHNRARGEFTPPSLDEDGVCRGRQIVLLPTGYGKSLCFLVPALILNGPTLVLYPLIALMADQMRRMEKGNLPAVIFKGGQSTEEREENFKKLKEGKVKIILANPEVLQNEELVNRLSQVGIAHIAIDEAHCVSEWGDSFRPAYLTLGNIIKRIKCPTVTAFTATASPPVLQRVCQVLFDGDAHLVQSASDRPNIHYEVRYAYAKEKEILRIAVTEERPMIIFCGTRGRTEQLSRPLADFFGYDKVRFYHAGMTREEKEAVQTWFQPSIDGIIVCTCAWGMGMDKANVRTVAHLDCPEHLENFIQEAGRAGRDGSQVKSILVWNYADKKRFENALPLSREAAMGGYALTTTCRRQYMLDQLGGEKTVCSGCDICDSKRMGKSVRQVSGDADLVYRYIRFHRRMYKKAEITSPLQKIFNGKDRPLFKINVWEAKDIAEIISQLTDEGKILEKGGLWEGVLDICGKGQKKQTAQNKPSLRKKLLLPRLLLPLRGRERVQQP